MLEKKDTSKSDGVLVKTEDDLTSLKKSVHLSFLGYILLLFLILVFSFLLIDLNQIPKKSLVNNYDTTSGSNNIVVSTDSGLGFKKIELDSNTFYILSYLNDEKLDLNLENESIKSLNIGEYCISISGVVLDVNSIVLRSKMTNLLLDLCEQMGDFTDITEICSTSFDTYYTLTYKEDSLFINYITPVEKYSNYLIYYRFIIKDVDSLNISITDEERVFLHNNLQELGEVLGINVDLENYFLTSSDALDIVETDKNKSLINNESIW